MGIGFTGGISQSEVTTAVDDAANPQLDSGIVGYDALLTTEPNELNTTTSGGGAVTFSQIGGMKVAPGGTSGDEARVTDLEVNNFASASLIRSVLVYKLGNGTADGVNNDFQIGSTDPGTGNTAGAYLDLTNENYVVGGTTTGASIPGNDNATVKLVVETDIDSGETRFSQSGDVSESVTISETSINGQAIVDSKSNGNDDECNFFYVRRTIFHESP